LTKAGNARVVSLSSTGVRFGSVDFDDPKFEQHPRFFERFGISQRRVAKSRLFWHKHICDKMFQLRRRRLLL